MNYKNEHFKVFEKEYEDQFDENRKENVDEKEKYISEKLTQLRIHQLLKQLQLNDLVWEFDCTSLYPSAMWDKSSVYPKIETGYPFSPEMNDEQVTKFNNQTLTRESAILKIKFYNPKNLNVQHLPVKEKVNKIEINCMRNGYNIQVLTTVDKQEFVEV